MLHHCFTQPTKWTKKQMNWLTCGPVGRSLRRPWIYIQRPTFFFNLSSSSPSAAGTACSSLQRPAALFCAPQRNTTPPTARPSLHSPTPPIILWRRQPHTAAERVNPRTVVVPSAWETTAESSLPPCRSLPSPRRRPPPWCSRRGLVNVVNDRHASEVDCTWRG